MFVSPSARLFPSLSTPLISLPSRSFSISSDRLRALPNRNWSPKTLRRRSISQSRSTYMNHEEFQAARRPWPFPVLTKLPVELRPLNGDLLMRTLQREEQVRMDANYPRHIDRFVCGDRVCVTKYLSLSDKSKIERLSGVVISTSRLNTLDGRFIIRNTRLDEPVEMNIPLWSPFIIRIDLLQRGEKRFPRRKMLWIRKQDRNAYETILSETLPKTHDGARTLSKDHPLRIHFVQKQAKLRLNNKRATLPQHVLDALAGKPINKPIVEKKTAETNKATGADNASGSGSGAGA